MTRKMRRDSIYRSEEIPMREAIKWERDNIQVCKSESKSVGQPPYCRRIITEGRVGILGGKPRNW